MKLEVTKDKMDKVLKNKKAEREAKKSKKAEAKKAKFLVSPAGKILTQIEERNATIDALQAQYEYEVATRGQDLRTWPMEVLVKLKEVAPYEAFGIVLPGNAGADTSSQNADEFDLTKGFKPTVQTEPELIHPFKFMENAIKVEKPKKDSTMTDAEFAALESVFAKLLVNQKYRYESFNGIYKLFITRINEVEEEYIIDNGSVLGGSSYSILANKTDDTVFISINDPEIPEILKSKFYIVSEDCVKRNEDKLMHNGYIYNVIDFSNTAWLNDKDVDLKTLENSLTGSIQVAINCFGNCPRMRFIKFESATKFELISDTEVKFPLSEIGASSNFVVPGFRIKVEDNKITTYNSEILTGQYLLNPAQ